MKFGKPGKIFIGWWIVIVTATIQGLALCFTSQGASVLFKPIAADLGISRTSASFANGIGTVVIALTFALAAWLLTKFGPKWLMVTGAVLLGAASILLRLVSSPAAYYVVWGLAVSSGTLGFSIAIDSIVTNWFVRKRGLAFSLKWGIVSLVTISLLPVLSWMVETWGWRQASTIWGSVIIVSIIFILIFVKQKPPEFYNLLPDGAKQQNREADVETIVETGKRYASEINEREFSYKQAIKTTAYWMLNVGWIIWMLIQSSFNLHIIPFLTDRGIDAVAAASMLALMIFFTLPSRIFGSVVADHIKKERLKYLLAGSLFLMAGGIGIFLLFPTTVGVYILLFLYGLGFGAYNPLDSLVRARYFGRRAYGSLQGLAMVMTIPLTFLSPIYAAWTYDTMGTYIPAFTLFAILAFVSSLVICFIRIPELKEV